MRLRSLRLLILTTIAAACGQEPPSQPTTSATLRATLDRHFAAVGATPPPYLRITGTLTTSSTASTPRVPFTTYIRTNPFAFRRELGSPTDPTPPPLTMITDGRTAWDASGRLLDAPTALLCLEAAFVDGLLYRAGNTTMGGPADDAPWPVPDHPQLPPDCPRNLRARTVAMHSPAGTMVQFHFDVATDLLAAVVAIDGHPAPMWTRPFDWRRFGPIQLPMRQMQGLESSSALVDSRVDDVQFPDSLPDELFAGNPRRPIAGRVDLGPLLAAPMTVPGSAALIATAVAIGDRMTGAAYLDTGATQSSLTPALADALALPPRSRKRIITLTGATEHPQAWMQHLLLGKYPVLQQTMMVLQLPRAVGLPADRQPAVLIGTDVLFDGSPVFVFAAERVWLRGRPVEPLAATASGPVLRMPLVRHGDTVHVDLRIGDRTVRALLDTGMFYPLRLEAGTLARLGLPATPAEWTRDGALALPLAEAGGKATAGYVGTLPALQLDTTPPVRFDYSCAVFAEGKGDPDDYHAAILGAGTLANFARVGIDLDALVLELELPAGTPRAADGAYVIAQPGAYVGCSVRVPKRATADEPAPMPWFATVAPGSPAHRVGLRDGERLVSIDGEPAATIAPGTLQRRFWLQPGRTLELEVLGGDGKQRRVRLP